MITHCKDLCAKSHSITKQWLNLVRCYYREKKKTSSSNANCKWKNNKGTKMLAFSTTAWPAQHSGTACSQIRLVGSPLVKRLNKASCQILIACLVFPQSGQLRLPFNLPFWGKACTPTLERNSFFFSLPAWLEDYTGAWCVADGSLLPSCSKPHTLSWLKTAHLHGQQQHVTPLLLQVGGIQSVYKSTKRLIHVAQQESAENTTAYSKHTNHREAEIHTTTWHHVTLITASPVAEKVIIIKGTERRLRPRL